MNEQDENKDADIAVEPKTIKPNPSIKRKHIARLMAVQTIYACMIDKTLNAQDLLNWQAELPEKEAIIVSKPDAKLLNAIVFGAGEMYGSIVERLSELLGDRWNSKRMPMVMRAILICAMYEIIYTPKLAKLIIIDEYVGAADAFLDDKDVSFVNGVLQEITMILRA
jgi:transcription antitermination factor NusB